MINQINVGVIGTGWCGGIRANACNDNPLVNKLFIAETNIGLDENTENNLTFSLRHLQNKNRTIDFYVTNALGIEDIGQLLRSDNYKFGIKVSWIF